MTAKTEENGFRALKFSLRVDFALLILQFIVLASSMIYSYAKLSTEVSQVKVLMKDHTSKESNYVREDVWRTRNQFIDEKLDSIERKVDILLLQKADLYQDQKMLKK